MDYQIIKPRAGFIAIKEVKEEKSTLKKAGQSEANGYGKVVALGDSSKFELDQIVVYNEFEGQELNKFKAIDEDNIILIKEEEILAIIQL